MTDNKRKWTPGPVLGEGKQGGIYDDIREQKDANNP